MFWDITPCSPLKIYRCFGGTVRLHFQGRRMSQSRLCLLPASCCFFAWLILRLWRWRQHVLPKRQLIFNGILGIISQKIKVFITTAVRTWNSTRNIGLSVKTAVWESNRTSPNCYRHTNLHDCTLESSGQLYYLSSMGRPCKVLTWKRHCLQGHTGLTEFQIT
jgi:hypothetical protein